MESRSDLASIVPFLPLILRSSSLFWPPKVVEGLKALSMGPDVSRVDSGEVLFDAIVDLRDSLGLSGERMAFGAADGYATFFDELMRREHSRMWFSEVLPALARLLMRLPSLLEAHYRDSDRDFGTGKVGLRILHQQEEGIVFLNQELIAALLACSFFCLFPVAERSANHLPTINFDYLFAGLNPSGKASQEEKIRCLIHYFERVKSSTNLVSFERKVLPLECDSGRISYPGTVLWKNSVVPLCSFRISHSGLIEDQEYESLEVDFANEYLGGGVLHRGCVQEEIRFMINPELIAGMLFLPSMRKNEAVEIIGAERFSSYTGYAATFQYAGDYRDKRPFDSFGRRKTRIIAIDALDCPGLRQFRIGCLLRETNKAYCGFLDQSKYGSYLKALQGCVESVDHQTDSAHNVNAVDNVQCNASLGPNDLRSLHTDCETAEILNSSASKNEMVSDESAAKSCSSSEHFQVSVLSGTEENIGVATGNWGCGAFGGDMEVKVIIQWLAASQAFRPFILYHTFGEEALQRLEQVTQWILLHRWTVGNLWTMLVEYSCQRLNAETRTGLLNWLLPQLHHSTLRDAGHMSE